MVVFCFVVPCLLARLGRLFLGVASLVRFALLVGLVSMAVSFSACFLAVACWMDFIRLYLLLICFWVACSAARNSGFFVL
jgi:hypothetical protein